MGKQEPRHKIAPSPAGFTSFDAADAVEYAAFYGLVADEWQESTCEAWMRRTRAGRWCASTWGITVSRQNGKNGALEIVELFGMADLGLKFLHTAHEVKTARKAFIRLKYFFGEKANDPNAKFPELNALVKEVRNTNGQEAIVLHNGGSVEFIARSKGSGRGFTVDVLVLDEAQELQDHELESLLPTISAAPSGDPVTIFMGTPPADVGLIGEPFVRAREGAIDGSDKRIAWVEFSADGDVDSMTPDELFKFVRNRKNWAAANPALGGRMNESTIEGEIALFSARSFARERLNMWPAAGAGQAAIPSAKWADQKADAPEGEPVIAAIGLDMNHERTKVTIGIAEWADGGFHCGVAIDAPFDDAGTAALVDWVWERAGRRAPVVIDAFSPARSLEPLLRKRGMLVRVLTTGEFVQACGGFYDAIMKDKSVTHDGGERLADSVAGTFKDKVGTAGAFKWNRLNLTVDLGPIISVTCAHFGAVKFAKRPRVGSAKKRYAIVG
jgi:hypothetical protein